MKHFLSAAAVAVLVFGSLFMAKGYPPPAQALSNPLGELKGGASGDRVACGTSVTAIGPLDGYVRPKSMTIVNNSATAVFLGGSSVDATGGASVCSSGCDFTNSFSFDGAKMFCLVSSGSVNVKVLWSF